MTKKDYELLAEVLGQAHQACPDVVRVQGVHAVEERLVEALAADNPKFNKLLFMLAVSKAAGGTVFSKRGGKR